MMVVAFVEVVKMHKDCNGLCFGKNTECAAPKGIPLLSSHLKKIFSCQRMEMAMELF